MREKKQWLIVTFYTTSAAMAAEKACERQLQVAAAALVLGSDRVADGVSNRVCRALFHA